ncbi:TIGR02117 family protein [uncultured Roseibium sp.]|uniref:TIGR02117 family protein n=1 Tax=uncultured Roseibium sp. TaxID=1936171 RepID=UPI002610D6FD|nr:TIGR02117 family protein [uncultured Roseibium sp.]
MLVSIARKILWGGVLIAFGACLAMGLGILIPGPISVSAEKQDLSDVQTRQILILSNPIHTDIALPADPDVLEALSFVSAEGLELDYPGVFWIVVGWGGRSFYLETPTWAELKPGPVFAALTWDHSVMHVRRSSTIPPEHENVRTLALSPAEFQKLLKGVQDSFGTDTADPPRAIDGASYDAHDIFFPAKGGFNALVGCNTWTARMLRLAGVRTGLWTPLPSTLDWSLDIHGSG